MYLDIICYTLRTFEDAHVIYAASIIAYNVCHKRHSEHYIRCLRKITAVLVRVERKICANT